MFTTVTAGPPAASQITPCTYRSVLEGVSKQVFKSTQLSDTVGSKEPFGIQPRLTVC